VARAETAALVALLTLNDKGFSKGLTNAEKNLGKFESTAFRVGQNIGNGFKSLGKNLATIGAIGVGGLTLAVKGGLDDLATLENAVTSVDGAIQQLGLTGQLTGKQVAKWANDIEADIDAAFDDKAITQAATTLLRFGHVAPNALEPALRVVADLAAKTGDVESASNLLARALVDPTKAAGKLARAGVVLTKQQQEQIKAMTEAGDVAGAQAALLDAVAKSTAGAAKAMAGPYQDALNKTHDAVEDARKALAIGFLPIITKVADKMSKITADPKALASIEAFGKTLAGGLDSLISTAERLPWEAIGSSMQIAGMGAKALLDAFVSLPPWVQTAVLTGWGLNKLTGGALSGIVGELGKGLIKGVLGMNAGVVNINAATVNGVGVGGTPGTAAGALGAAGVTGRLAQIGNIVMKVAIVGIAADVANILKPAVVGAGITIHDALGLPTLKPDDLQWPFGPKNTPTILPEIFGGNGALGGTAPVQKEVGRLNTDPAMAERQNITNERLESIRTNQAKQNEKADALNAQFADVANTNDRIAAATEAAKSVNSQTASNTLRATERLEAIHGTTSQQLAAVHNAAVQDAGIAARNQAAAFAIRDRVGSSGALVTGAVNTVRGAVAATTAAARAAGQQTAAAVRDKDLSVAVTSVTNVSTTVAVRDFNKTFNSYKNIYRTVS
jgi:hypothetical protein